MTGQATLTLPIEGGKTIEYSDSNFADKASAAMSKREEYFPKLTTTKLRSIYANVANLYTKITDRDEFEKGLVAKLNATLTR